MNLLRLLERQPFPVDNPPQFICPRPHCLMCSWNPGDRERGWCGRCNDYTGVPVTEAASTRRPRLDFQALPTPAGRYGWHRYERTCAPDQQVDGLGDLALFLGGSENSFTGELLKLVAKAQASPERFAALQAAFPREVVAWRVWMAYPTPPAAAALCATLTSLAPR